jgi:tetratricopeptide (TPR) repeat protein
LNKTTLTGQSKSQLAIRHAHNIYDAAPQPFVFWVHASTRPRFEEAYRGIADRLELPGRHDPKADVLRLVSDWLHNEANGRWTMVLDNVDDVETFFPSQKHKRHEPNQALPTSLAAYLPQSRNGSILITSRSKDAAARLVGGYSTIKEVLTMDEDQGVKLLSNKLQSTSAEDGAAADLVRALDCMPLAISQAAAYINRRARMTTTGYLKEFCASSKKKESLLNWDAGDLRRDESASNSVITTWQMLFERIRQERPSAGDLLLLMSCFNPQGIPEWILRSHSKSVAETGNEDLADRAFDEDLDLLQAYSLVAATTGSEAWEMHALVQYCTQVWLSTFHDPRQWTQVFAALMASEFPRPDFNNWSKCQQLLPHCDVLYETELFDGEFVERWAGMLNHIAQYMQAALGRYSDAETLNWRAMTRVENVLGAHHPSTLTSVSNLAAVLQYQGKYDEAEKLNRRALEGRAKELGVHHPSTLTSVGNLALVLQYEGKYDEAVKLNRRALEGMEKALGVHHPSTLTSVSNLALVLQYQGKYEEAVKLNRRALEGMEKALGIHHPSTLTSVSNLAAVLRYQGKYDEAVKLNRRALEGREKALGVHHPSTLTSVSNLATVLQYQGKYGEAEKLNRRALEGREKALGVHHPSTLTSVSNLAAVSQYQGKYGEAEKLNRRALEGKEKELGVHHPETLSSVYCLAHLLHTLRQYPEAAELYQRACDGYTQQLGCRHPKSLACRNSFAAMQQAAEQARLP